MEPEASGGAAPSDASGTSQRKARPPRTYVQKEQARIQKAGMTLNDKIDQFKDSRKQARLLVRIDKGWVEIDKLEEDEKRAIEKVEATYQERLADRAMAVKLLAKAESDRAKASVTIDLTEDS